MSKSNEKDTNVEPSAEWDWDNAKQQSGQRDRRTVVSVGFPREDFEKVAQLAEQLGWNVSAFIRSATLEKVARVTMEATKRPLTLSEPLTSAIPPAPSTSIRWGNMRPSRGILRPDIAVTEVTASRIVIPI